MSTSGDRTSNSLAEALRRLAGRELSSVEFVRDYVQLRFDGACLTAHVLPVVETNGKRFPSNAPGWRDELCRRIGRKLSGAEVERGVKASLRFEDGASITISLRDEDYRGPEALQFDDGINVWVV